MLTIFICYVVQVSRITHAPLGFPAQKITLSFTEGSLDTFKDEFHNPKHIRDAVCGNLERATAIANGDGP